MKSTFIIAILLAVILTAFNSCNNSNNNKSIDDSTLITEKVYWQNAVESKSYSTMVDFIVRYPFTQKLDSALYLFHEYAKYIDFCECTPVEVYSDIPDTILIEGIKVSIKDCRKFIIESLLNENNNWHGAHFGTIYGPNGDTLEISKTCFEINYLKNEVEGLRPTIIEISAALHDYRDTLALQWFKIESNKLPEEQLKFIESLVFPRIILLSWESVPFNPPPPICEGNNKDTVQELLH